MSTMPPNLEQEMEEIQRAYQQYQHDLTDQLKEAHGLIQAGRAHDAYAAFEQAQHQVSAFYDAWEARLMRSMAGLGVADTCRQNIAQERATVLWGLGSAAALVGKRDHARASFKQALALIGDQPTGERAMLLNSSADLCVKDGLFDEAEGLYAQARADYEQLGLWQQCAMAVTALADCAHARGDRDGFLRHLDEAIQLAQTHQLPAFERDLQLKKYRVRLSTDPTGATLQEIRQEIRQLKLFSADARFRADVNMLIAEFAVQRGDLDSGNEAYEDALACANDDPTKQWLILLGLAGICETRRQIREAIHFAEQALNITKQLGLQDPTGQTLQTLIALRTMLPEPAQRAQAEEELTELRQMQDPQALTLTLLMRASSWYQTKEFESALSDLVEAERIAPTIELRQRVLSAQTATLQTMGRREDALAANLKSISLLDAQLAAGSAQSLTQWKDRLRDFAVLHRNAAELESKLGRAREAFHDAETGKAQLLRRQLEQAGLSGSAPAETTEPSFDEVRGWLATDSAALVMFCVSNRETLMLVVEPSQSEPLSVFAPLTESELQQFFPSETVRGEEWNDVVFKALPALSAKLLHPLEDVIRRCKVLYIVPESQLYFVPFAALTLEDHTCVIEHCAVAYTPSATILRWSRSRRAETRARAILAVGVGHEDEYSFADEAKAIAENGRWGRASTLLEATAQQFLEQAPRYPVLHLSCHGEVEPGILDTLSSSRLQFADRMLTAKEIFDLHHSLQAQLVFLNACRSGSFRSELDAEVSGFWQAFLTAGAASLIATLAYVHPGYARQLAQDFYREWLTGGVTKAEALRRAQLAMLRQHVEPRYWACHVLIGDHR